MQWISQMQWSDVQSWVLQKRLVIDLVDYSLKCQKPFIEEHFPKSSINVQLMFFFIEYNWSNSNEAILLFRDETSSNITQPNLQKARPI